MKHTNTTEFKNKVREYLNPIIIDALEAREKPTEGDIYSAIIDCARGEVPHEFDRHGPQRGLAEWLQGLGMGLDYMNYDIRLIAEKWHNCKLSEKEAEKIISGWWMFIAHKMIQFANEH